MYKEPLQPGSTYHIFNRGNNKENLFKEEKNYWHFINLSQKYIQPVANVYAYSLQPNHFHYLIEIKKTIGEKYISQAFANWFNAYAKSINKAYERTGSLFQERFGRELIDSDSYFSNALFYIHSNAQRHQLVKDFRTYPYNSYQILLSDKPTFLDRDTVLDWFGNRERFEKFHNQRHEILAEYLLGLSSRGL